MSGFEVWWGPQLELIVRLSEKLDQPVTWLKGPSGGQVIRESHSQGAVGWISRSAEIP